jgi:hypothetical protein
MKPIHTIYIQSKNRDAGETNKYTINLPEFIMNDANLEIFKLSLSSFTTYNNMLQVADGKNRISIDGTLYQIPYGTYTYQKLAKVIDAIIPASVVWNVETNSMTFEFEATATMSFDGLGETLGFSAGNLYTGSILRSERAMNPYLNPHIVIHLNNITPINDRLCFSNHSGQMRVENILGKILINASPFQIINYNQVLESDGLYSADNSLTSLEFLITDNDGNLIEDMPEHEMVLKIESLDIGKEDSDTIIALMKDIKTTLKDTFLYKTLRFKA